MKIKFENDIEKFSTTVYYKIDYTFNGKITSKKVCYLDDL